MHTTLSGKVRRYTTLNNGISVDLAILIYSPNNHSDEQLIIFYLGIKISKFTLLVVMFAIVMIIALVLLERSANIIRGFLSEISVET